MEPAAAGAIATARALAECDELARRWALELRSVAMHEYAHLHVARHFAVWGWVHIRARPEADGLERPFFSGQFTAEALDDPHARQVIGLAGVCAEALDHDSGITPLRMSRLIAEGRAALSPADRAMAAAFETAHVAESLAILRSSWPAIVMDAHGAIELEIREADRAPSSCWR